MMGLILVLLIISGCGVLFNEKMKNDMDDIRNSQDEIKNDEQ